MWLKAGWRQKAMKREANYPKSLESMQDVHHVIFFLPFSDQMLQIPASVHRWTLQWKAPDVYWTPAIWTIVQKIPEPWILLCIFSLLTIFVEALYSLLSLRWHCPSWGWTRPPSLPSRARWGTSSVANTSRWRASFLQPIFSCKWEE